VAIRIDVTCPEVRREIIKVGRFGIARGKAVEVTADDRVALRPSVSEQIAHFAQSHGRAVWTEMNADGGERRWQTRNAERGNSRSVVEMDIVSLEGENDETIAHHDSNTLAGCYAQARPAREVPMFVQVRTAASRLGRGILSVPESAERRDWHHR
jgi:hypothetical protein